MTDPGDQNVHPPKKEQCSETLDLFDSFGQDAYARSTDPETSHEAAAKVDAAGQEVIIQDALLSRGPRGATSRELAELTGLDRVTVSPRLKPMERKGLVMRTDERRDGGIVWVAL